MLEKLRIDFNRRKEWVENPLNAVGATTSLTLRATPAAPGPNDAYVKKYGTAYAITDVTNGVVNIPRGAPNTIRYRIYAEDGTLMGTITDNGASAYADGAALPTPQRIYVLVDVPNPGPANGPTNGDTITLTTDVDPGGLTLILPG